MNSRRSTDMVLERARRLHALGSLVEAEQLYREVLAVSPRVATAWNSLAIVLCQQSRFEPAVQAAIEASTHDPKIAAYWLTRGNAAASCGRERDAQSSFRRAIKLKPGFSDAHYWLGRSYERDGRLLDAVAAYCDASRHAPERAENHYRLGRVLLALDRLPEALAAYEEAFKRDPSGALDRRECLDCFKAHHFDVLPEFWHGEVVRFLRRQDIDKSCYVMAALRVLMARPAFRALRTAAETSVVGCFEIAAAQLDEVMNDALFGLLLRDTLIAQPEFEVVLTRLRAALLLDDKLHAQAPLEFLCDLALQCFNNEFVFAEEQHEGAKIAEIGCNLESALADGRAADERLRRLAATWAMYHRLYDMPGVEALRPAHEILTSAFERLLRRTVSDLIEERRLRSSIRVIGSISDPVSQAVRAQYEANPYPRWLSFERPPRTSVTDWIRNEVPDLTYPLEFSSPLRILVAGCGTGVETLSLASSIAGASVMAVDLSLSSLAYAQRKATELGIANVEFCHADILELGALEQRFDVIYCIGVLTHIPEPRRAVQVLAALLRHGGLLKVGVYSERARGRVNIARENIRAKHLRPSDQAIREVRREIFASDEISVLRDLLRWRDFYSMSECRDLLFHVEEHQFKLAELDPLLREHDLTVLGMSKQLPRPAILAYRSMFPGDTAMTNLHNWESVEAQYPDTFLGMYQVWSRSASRQAA